MNPLRLVLLVCAITTLGCCSNARGPCFNGSCPPKTIKECIVRVGDSLGKHASHDHMVDLDHDGIIGGTDFTLCREGDF